MNRHAARAHALDGDGPCTTCDDPLAVAERRELSTQLGEALMALPRTDRLLFLLAAEGLNSVELAERFELSHDAVRSRLKRARQHLRVALKDADTLFEAASTTGVNPSPREPPHERHDDDHTDPSRPVDR